MKAKNKYGAKLLFQWRVMVGRSSGKRRTCEERIINFTAGTARAALREAKRFGKKAEFDYKNSDGNPVFFEFVGVMDLLHLGSECGQNEVWYDIVERVKPMERRKLLIPPERQLSAIKYHE